MILFLLGVVAGLILATLVAATAIYLNKAVAPHVHSAIARIENAGPRQRGFIVEPAPEAEEARQRIIERNRKQGRDTHIDELR